MIVLIIMYCFMILDSTLNFRKVKKIKVQLDARIALVHVNEYKSRKYRYYTQLLLPLLLLGLMFYMNHYSDKLRWEKNLSEYEGKHPTISIAALETSPSFSIAYNWSTLTSAAYKIGEHGEMPGQMWADDSGTYSPSMEAEYFEMRSIFLAEVLYEELLERKMDRRFYETAEYK